ncbi:hypothetical protein B0H19DRAFT_1242563 [Mycena capillaripes]|nr:hypothetical protein B0H19DRAFT_1242563 [Mycena capillaripes]
MKEMEYLKASCNKLKYLVQTDRSTSPAVRKELTSLVNGVQECDAVKSTGVCKGHDPPPDLALSLPTRTSTGRRWNHPTTPPGDADRATAPERRRTYGLTLKILSLPVMHFISVRRVKQKDDGHAHESPLLFFKRGLLDIAKTLFYVLHKTLRVATTVVNNSLLIFNPGGSAKIYLVWFWVVTERGGPGFWLCLLVRKKDEKTKRTLMWTELANPKDISGMAYFEGVDDKHARCENEAEATASIAEMVLARVECAARHMQTLEPLKRSIHRGLRYNDDFPPLYLRFCELIAQQEDTTEIVRDLRKMAKDELEKAKVQLEGFGALKRRYSQDRQDLAAFFQDNVDAAKKAGLPEGASSSEQSQQILDEMDNIEKSLSKIGDILEDNKEFWEGVDRRLKSVPPPPSGLLANGPPEGIISGPMTVNGTAAQFCGSHKMLKIGKVLIQDVSVLNRSCGKISSTQSSVEAQLQSPSCVLKHRRKVLRPLTNGLSSLVQGYEKFARRFAEYWGYISLLFWYEGSSLEEKLGADRCNPVALTNLTLEGLSPYALPLESAFVTIHRQLLGMTKFWRELKEALHRQWAAMWLRGGGKLSNTCRFQLEPAC